MINLNTLKSKIVMGSLVMILSLPVMSQTVIWEEDFKVTQGWYLEDNWFFEGAKMQFYWNPQIQNFDQSALSPLIYIDESVEDLVVTQYLDVFNGTANETAEIIVVTEDDEIVIWSHVLENGNWGNQMGSDISLPMTDFAGQEVRLKFRTFGEDTFNWNFWVIFEIKINAVFDRDIAVISAEGPHSVGIGEEGIWSVSVVNLGNNEIADFTVELYCYNTGTLIGTIEDNEPLMAQDVRNYNFEWTPTDAYNTVLYGVVESAEDEFSGNNGSDGYFLRIAPDIDFNVMVWDYDNGIQTVIDPEKGDLIRPAIGLQRSLDNAGIQYETYTYLPMNLSDYDIVVATMGCFCVD
jgi:hypothetical protein